MIPNDKLILNDQRCHSLGYLGSIWFHSELSEVTYFTSKKLVEKLFKARFSEAALHSVFGVNCNNFLCISCSLDPNAISEKNLLSKIPMFLLLMKTNLKFSLQSYFAKIFPWSMWSLPMDKDSYQPG